jgi:Arc/MetJ-type ribon-helix-helix transcriptional regulator
MALTKPVTVTIPEDVLEAARARVEAGDADSLSAYVTGALRRRLEQDERLSETINWVHETFGKPTEEDMARVRAMREEARERRRLRDEGNPAA